jgi:hypothetical protein
MPDRRASFRNDGARKRCAAWEVDVVGHLPHRLAGPVLAGSRTPRLPNAVIAGVNKAGTTSLFHALAGHPDVQTSKVKETHFFDPIKYGEQPPPLSEYATFFPGRGTAPVVLEATPGYFYGGEPMARALEAALPGARTVIVLREPGARAFSWWRFCRAGLLLDPDLSFDEYLRRCAALGPAPESSRDLVAWRGLSGGMYSRYLPAWQETFGERLLILFHEDLVSDPGATVNRVCRHLGIPEVPTARLRRDNVTVDVSNRALQRVAMRVNAVGERFWRTAPGAKAALRSLYYRVNARGSQDRLEVDQRQWLADHYAEELSVLRGLLAGRGPLPAWLEAP